MAKPNWQQVKDLFAEAIEHHPDSRLEFLKNKCNGDDVLFNEVNSLLAASSEPENLIENNAIDLAAKVGAHESDRTEQHFGHYKILREIGSGGMGTVFLARRDDGEFSMHVALKIVRQSVADRDIIVRFKRERQILANLNHPNIAVLHDGGVSEKGEPFLAMEYVDGETLTEYAEKHNLSIREKLKLFLKICSAVSYAHRNLVVHRDIKPSNILVTSEGEPKLLDFGLAKAFESDTSKTQTALRAFTPAYASPEQIQGQNITTASDIYSLGVVFYELLTGAKPFNFDNKSYEEILKTASHSAPPLPSANPHASINDPQLKGDLDNIALTALRKEPERRFKTVEDFADDIRRYLDGLPISARPNTTRYLAGKFIQRNKIAVAAAVLIFVSLVTALVFSLWQADEARKERDRAEKRFQDIRQLSNSLLFDISPKIERLPGSLEAREMLVQKALEYLDSLRTESQNDLVLSAELASAYEKVGDLQGNIDKPNLSDFSGAVSSFEKARAIRESLPAEPNNLLRLAQNLRIASQIRNRQNDVKGALLDAEAAKNIFTDLVLQTPDAFDLRMAAIEAEMEHGQMYAYNNQYSEGIPLFRAAIDALEKTDQNHQKTRRLTAKVYAYLGNALSWEGQQPAAETEMTKALSIAERLASEFPNDSEIQTAVWQVYILASSIYEGTRDDISFDLAKRALATAAKAAEADKADSQATYNLARSYSRVGITLANVGKLPDAALNLRQAEKIFNEMIEREPKNVIYQRDLATLYVRMGETSEKLRDLPDALLKYQNSAVIYEQIANADELNTLAQRDLAQSLRSIGKMQIALEQVPNAKATLQRARDILNRLKEKNALGGYDQQLVNDVEKILSSI
ncbi:MAG: protein kinase domain-containing protein [Pyrinomonadaceae bacterium]